MFSGPDLAARRRSLAARRDDVADIRTSVQGATPAGGTLQRLMPGLPAVAGPQDAAAFVRARAAEGADYLKIYLEDPAWYGSPGLSAATVRALVEAAHAHGMLAIAHADSAAMARMFIQAGGDALAHVLADLEVTPAFLDDLRRRPAFVIATLRATAVVSAAHARQIEADQRELARHPRLSPFLDQPTRAAFTRPGLLADARAHSAAAPCAGGRLDFAGALRSVAALHQAGIQVLAGTDTNYPDPRHGNATLNAYAGHGITLHHELALLVRAGLSPAAALAAATSVPARLFGLTDRGRIARGLRADLLLIDGDPCADITATRNIAAIWRNGTRLHRAAAGSACRKVLSCAKLKLHVPTVTSARYGVSAERRSMDDRRRAISQRRQRAVRRILIRARLSGCPVFVVLGRGDEVEGGKVGAVPIDVAGQEPVAGDGGVRADVEVRHRGPLGPSAAPVLQECLAGGEAGEVRQWLALVGVGGEQVL
jgi:hypothetical protein